MASHLAPNHFLFPCSNINSVAYNPKNNRISHHNYPNQPKLPNPAKSSSSHPKWKPANQTPRSLVSDLPRKWCNFVLRRDPDNVLYRSESFRFIQKTSSLEPLIPRRNGFRNKLKLALVPVSDDYVEPLDQVDFKTHHLNVSSQDSRRASSRSIRKPEHEYNEIPENYNAPYYYSDTLKGASTEESTDKKECSDSTYCSPCNTLGTLPATPKFVSSSSASVRSLRPTTTSSSSSPSQQRTPPPSLQPVPNPASGQPPSSAAPMARKRYETAFLPTTASHPSQSPDADMMLLSIQSASLVPDPEDTAMSDWGEARASRPASSSANYNISRRREPSISYYSGDEDRVRLELSRGPMISRTQTHVHPHAHSSHNSPLLGQSDSQSSTSSPARTIPHSEPLPQKRYLKLHSAFSTKSSSGCSTTSSSSPSQDSAQRRAGVVGEKSLLQMKDNSVSSLESIDSAKSEEVKYAHRFHVRGGHSVNLKLLSPISDKSPLEPPIPTLNPGDVEELEGRNSADSAGYQWTKRNLVSAAEQLTNVPWEMPKLRRRLALLADSGISIDYPPSRDRDLRKDFDDITISHNLPVSRETEANPRSSSPLFFYGKERKSLSTAPTAHSSHIRNNFQLKLPKENAYYDVSTGEDVGTDAEASRIDLEKKYHVDQDERNPRDVKVKANPSASAGRANSFPSQYYSGEDRYEMPIRRNTSTTLTTIGGESLKPDRCKMTLHFGADSALVNPHLDDIQPDVELEVQDWFHGAITRSEAESILRATKEGSFLVRNCESSTFNRFSLSLKSSRGFIHIRIEPNSLGTFSLGEQEFPSVPHLVLYFMTHRLPIKGAEHVKLKYPVITQLL